MKFSFQLAFTWRNQFSHKIVRYLTIILRGRAGYEWIDNAPSWMWSFWIQQACFNKNSRTNNSSMLILFDFLFLRSAKMLSARFIDDAFLNHIRYSTGIWTDMIACVRRASENATNLISVIQCFIKADNTSFLWLCCSFLCCSSLVSGYCDV